MISPLMALSPLETLTPVSTLNNAELPIELVQAILLVKSKPALSDEETTTGHSVG